MGILVLALPVAVVAFVVALARRHGVTVGINEHAEVVRIARSTPAPGGSPASLVGLLVAGVLAASGPAGRTPSAGSPPWPRRPRGGRPPRHDRR